MKCIKCETEMIKAKLAAGVAGCVYVLEYSNKLFETSKQSSLSCYACPKCGYIELQADDPQKLV